MMDKWKRDALISREAELQVNLSLIGIMSLLEKPAGGFMTAAERISVDAERGQIYQVGKIIKILRQKGNEEFEIFLKILNESGNEVWAHALARSADQFQQEYAHCASLFSVSQFLKTYEREFLEVVNPKLNLVKLEHEGVISANVRTAILETADDKDANYILLVHLQKNATVYTLRVYCDVAIAANGYSRMQELGKKMKDALPPGGPDQAPDESRGAQPEVIPKGVAGPDQAPDESRGAQPEVIPKGVAAPCAPAAPLLSTIRPALKDLVVYVIPRVASEWYNMGLQLDLEPYILNEIENKDNQPRRMFDKWLQGPACSWQSVLNAVEKACGSRPMEDIQADVLESIASAQSTDGELTESVKGGRMLRKRPSTSKEVEDGELTESMKGGRTLRKRPSTSKEVEVDGFHLQQLCYMATDIKELLITPAGGTFTLGSGDASLKFPPGAVAMESSIHYAIILDGPFVFPSDRYQLASVVVYINMDGVILLKPAELLLTHWCSKEESDDEDVLKFLTAPHTLEAEQEYYGFDEQEEADFTTHANAGILKIAEPKCLHCVNGKIGKIARYRAASFTQYVPSENTLLFRIQLMCDSLEWNESLTHALQQDEWKKTIGNLVTRFEYTSKRKPISPSPHELKGPGWSAKIEGNCKVQFKDFLLPKGNSKSEIKKAISSGLSPPCILYKVFYSIPAEQQVKPAELTVALHGEDLELRFNCRIMEGMYVHAASVDTSLHSPYSSQEATAPILGAARSFSSPQAEISYIADVIIALDHRLDTQWREFGTFLHVTPAFMDGISNDKSNVTPCMLQLVEKWFVHEDGTGDLPRTWQTVVQVVKQTGKGRLAEQLAEQYGVQLPVQ